MDTQAGGRRRGGDRDGPAALARLARAGRTGQRVEHTVAQPPGETAGPGNSASSGFGALTVRALAERGHPVYAGIRAADVADVAEAVVRALELPPGRRPFRIHVDPSRDRSEVVSAVADRIRVEFFRRVGLDGLLTRASSL
ncbi:hypothetical protein [Streptomyces sp. NBC_00847]|uniref:hypothetical protein n=1 Tax=Streptomyces sp. NBC_00847 TaxID=2975850 RepID=UPI00225DD795|nr:hypothetical protein [Streptomyces sp. NBC_00847]MCX4885812.1 hypothetical protein [Streptomyces sp. NBC_00847]